MLYACQSGHPGGSLSCVEILQALYENVLRYDPENPRWPERDRLVLSKGHACPTLYAILADKGFFPKEELKNLRQFGSILQGHPDMNKCPGVDASTGSLGQGTGWALGYALIGKRPGHHFNVYCVTGDGESQEGMVWESAMAAAHYHLDNLTVLLDYNGLQIDGPNDQVMSLGDICAKYEAFGWEAIAVDGHDVDAIEMEKAVFAAAKYQGPVYLRTGRLPTDICTDADTPFEIGVANVLRDGRDVAIIACGIMVPQALLAAEALAKKGVGARVIDMHTVKPLDEAAVLAAAKDCGAVVTEEEQSIIGGLGSAVAEVLADKQCVPFERVGIKDKFGQSGKPPVLFDAYGLTDRAIVEACERVLARK